MGYPPFALNARRLEGLESYLSDPTTQMLISPDLQQYLIKAESFVNKASSCDNSMCHSIKENVDFVSIAVRDTVKSLTTVMNLAGCLFFAVANLGFASYDALLTFPQERAVFNHETANGLYGVSSYFLAKNVAGEIECCLIL